MKIDQGLEMSKTEHQRNAFVFCNAVNFILGDKEATKQNIHKAKEYLLRQLENPTDSIFMEQFKIFAVEAARRFPYSQALNPSTFPRSLNLSTIDD
jgi:hypothetical protein